MPFSFSFLYMYTCVCDWPSVFLDPHGRNGLEIGGKEGDFSGRQIQRTPFFFLDSELIEITLERAREREGGARVLGFCFAW